MNTSRILCALLLASTLLLSVAPNASASGGLSPVLSPASSRIAFSWTELPGRILRLIGSAWEKEGASLDPSGLPKPGGSTPPPPVATASGEDETLPLSLRASR